MSRPPAVLGTLEAALYAEDLDAAVAFWTDIMGLTCFQRVENRHAFFSVSRNPPQVLLVFCASTTIQPPRPDAHLPVPPHGARGPGHVCLAVAPATMPEWRDHLEAQKIDIEADFKWPNGARSIYLRDPAGNSIELADPAIWAGA